jgi:hypothetical protein
MDTSLRHGPDHPTPDYKTVFNFSATQGVLRAAEKCNGVGECRKSHLMGGTMCPSFMATRNEQDTTRARANMLRHVLTEARDGMNAWDSEQVKGVMDLCLSCKGCKSECPSNVDVARLKAEWQQHYYDANGVLQYRVVGGRRYADDANYALAKNEYIKRETAATEQANQAYLAELQRKEAEDRRQALGALAAGLGTQGSTANRIQAAQSALSASSTVPGASSATGGQSGTAINTSATPGNYPHGSNAPSICEAPDGYENARPSRVSTPHNPANSAMHCVCLTRDKPVNGVPMYKFVNRCSFPVNRYIYYRPGSYQLSDVHARGGPNDYAYERATERFTYYFCRQGRMNGTGNMRNGEISCL